MMAKRGSATLDELFGKVARAASLRSKLNRGKFTGDKLDRARAVLEQDEADILVLRRRLLIVLGLES